VPLKNEAQIATRFGDEIYLIIDKKGKNILRKEILKNPYFEKDSPKGARFAKAVRADKVLTPQIGPNARENLQNFGIDVEIIPPQKNLEDILKEIERENGKEY